jgi:hypothetical protein
MKHIFFECRFARTAWGCIHVALSLPRQRNSFSPLQVLHSVIYWLKTWSILWKHTLQALICSASQQLMQTAIDFFSPIYIYMSI